MTVVEEICRAREGGRLLHDDDSNIAHLQIQLPIDVERVDGRGREDGAGREGEDLVIMAQGLRVGEEEVVREMVLQIRVEGVHLARRGRSMREAREEFAQHLEDGPEMSWLSCSRRSVAAAIRFLASDLGVPVRRFVHGDGGGGGGVGV